MTTPRDRELAQYIVKSTVNGTIRWEPTAQNTFIAPLRGDHTVSIERTNSFNVLSLRNREGSVILVLTENSLPELEDLFELARRNAYDVDKVIAEIIEPPSKKDSSAPIRDEDIPF
jgi:hypothetical protein